MVSPPSNGVHLSPAPTLVNGRVVQRYSPLRRYVLLVIFCLAQFLDAFNNSALFSAIPSLVFDLDMTESESTWIISAFQLTFASFLLISGKISDIYNPSTYHPPLHFKAFDVVGLLLTSHPLIAEFAFIAGAALLGIFSIGAGFVTDKIALIVLRALSGIAASLTIPSALTLLVNLFPEPAEQARAIGVFGGCGAIGNVTGLLIGAIFIQFANWSWVFWFVALVAIPIAAICVVLIPNVVKAEEAHASQGAKWKSLDLVGVSILTVALILFIFAVTSGSTSGWGSATVLAPLVISIAMVAAFFYYETRIPAAVAAVPPRTWFLPNFAVLFGVALLPYFWWTTIFTVFTTLWQNVYHWSVIATALRMFPLGILAFATSFTGSLSRKFSPKWILLFAQGLNITATILLHFADSPDRYFPFVLPAFILGTTGCMLAYTHTNIAIFRTSPSSMAGTVGAIFNGALQLGSAVGLAAVSSIETSVEKKTGGPTVYAGRAAAFWFVLAIICVEAISVLVFYRIDVERKDDSTSEVTSASEKSQEVEGVPIKEKIGDEKHDHVTVTEV